MAEWILGIETSCDETSAAVLRAEAWTAASLAGLVDPLAGRASDLRRRRPGAGQPGARAGDRLGGRAGAGGRGHPAVRSSTASRHGGPGLVGALLVGVMYGKTLAFSLDRPLLGVNHLEGHLFAPMLEDPELAPPFVGLLVSGGHTMLLDVPAWGRVPAARPDARRRRRRSVRQGGQPARARLSRRPSDRAARARGTAGSVPVPATHAPGARPRRAEPLRLLVQRTQDGGAPGRARRAARSGGRIAPILPADSRTPRLDVLVAKTAHAVEALGYPTAMIGGGVACNRSAG